MGGCQKGVQALTAEGVAKEEITADCLVESEIAPTRAVARLWRKLAAEALFEKLIDETKAARGCPCDKPAHTALIDRLDAALKDAPDAFNRRLLNETRVVPEFAFDLPF
jgi:hypothetical protein